MKLSSIAALALTLTGALGAGLAQAGTDVQWSVTIGAPAVPVYVQPAPVYVRPAPVYAPAPPAPPPVYLRAEPVYVQPVPIYLQPVPVYGHRHTRHWDRDGDGIPNRHDPRDDRRFAPRWDDDRDGVPNRHDRHPGNPWRY